MYAGISITGTVGRSYRLEYTTDINQAIGWQNLATVTLTQSPHLYIDTGSAGEAKRFYRATLVP